MSQMLSFCERSWLFANKKERKDVMLLLFRFLNDLDDGLALKDLCRNYYKLAFYMIE